MSKLSSKFYNPATDQSGKEIQVKNYNNDSSCIVGHPNKK
jgi:hypothetical protein